MVFRRNDLDVANQLLWTRVIEQKRIVLRGFVGQPAAARLFPRQMLVKNVNGMPGAGQLLATECARRPTTDNHIVSHSVFANFAYYLPRRGKIGMILGRVFYETGKSTKQNPASSIAPKTAAAVAEQVNRRTN